MKPRKSGKQKRLILKEKRRKRALAIQNINRYSKMGFKPEFGMVIAEHSALSHVCQCTLLPLFYMDKSYSCRNCGSNEIWTAKQQKWWYETIKGHIDSTAVHCRRCRKAIRDEKLKQKEHMKEMAKRVPHPNEIFLHKNK